MSKLEHMTVHHAYRVVPNVEIFVLAWTVLPAVFEFTVIAEIPLYISTITSGRLFEKDAKCVSRYASATLFGHNGLSRIVDTLWQRNETAATRFSSIFSCS
jgi:hypothetical protein